MQNSIWQFATSPTLKFGRGCRWLLLEQLRRHAICRPLIVTDRTVAQTPAAAGLLTALQEALPIVIFDQGQAEPAIAVAQAACELGRPHRIDGVIGLGGGSNLDVAKIVATVLRHGGQPQDYFGFDRIPAAVLPLFALPTTAGTGSEISHSAVLTDPQQQVKVSTLSPWLRPTAALVDPELTDSCPPRVTAHSGIDALVHAIEAYTNRDYREMLGVDPQARAYEGSFPVTRLLAGEAIRLIGHSLVTCVEDPTNHAARDSLALAATLAGMAFSNSGVAITHALEYPIGVLTHCSHGEGNGLLLPHVMRFNRVARESEFAQIAQWLGASLQGLSPQQAADQAIARVEWLIDHVGITKRLRDLGLQPEAIPAAAAKAFEVKRLMDVNPRTPRLEDLQAILQAAY